MNNLSSFVKFVSLFFFFVFSVNSQSPPEAPKSVPPLEIGRTVEREIGGVYVNHSFKITLSVRQYIRVEAEQSGCDVIFALISQDGSNVFDVNNASPDKLEFASAAVEKAGEYQLNVMSVKEGKGNYILKIAELREATEKEINLTAGIALSNAAFDKGVSSATGDEINEIISKYENALEKFRLAEAKSFESRTFNQIGTSFMRLGDSRTAVEHYRKALAISTAINDEFEISLNLSNLGAAFAANGDWQKAFDAFSESLAIRREIKHYRGQAINLIRIGNLFQNAGDAARALDYFQEALNLIRAEPMAGGYEADVLQSVGRAHLSESDFSKAHEFFREALESSRRNKSKRREAAILSDLAQTAFMLGEIAESSEFLEESLKISRALQDKIGENATLTVIGRFALEKGETDRAAEAVNRSLEISRVLENPQMLAESLLYSARTDAQKQFYEAAQAKIEEAIELVEKVRAKVKTTDLRDAFSANLQNYYDFYIELLMNRHAREPNKNFAEKAFQASERARARSLLNLLNESNFDVREGVERSLLEKESETRSRLSARLENLTRIYGGKSAPEQIQKLKREIERIRSDYEQVQSQIRASSPRYSALTQPQSLDLAGVRRDVLDDQTVLLEYQLGERKSYLWLVERNSFRTIEIAPKAEIEKNARDFYEALTARNKRVKFETAGERRLRIEQADGEILEHSEKLSELLLKPAQKFFGGKKLLIVAGGALQYVPFAALQTESGGEPRFLIETNEIVNLQSASVLAILRRETNGRTPAPKTLAIMADPVFDDADERFKTISRNKLKNPSEQIHTETAFAKTPLKKLRDFGFEEGFNLERLPFTRREADAISSLVPLAEREKRLDFTATREYAVSKKLADFRYLHFATHSFINDKTPELSGIVLSLLDEAGRERDGILRTSDVFNLKLPAELVVLSGCRTGLGKQIKGEGLIGLTRGFMYAGAKRVAVSLWDVDDEATAELMTIFYRKMLGKNRLTPAAALRSAQIAMLRGKHRQNPYYWSAFILQGEPK